MSAVDEVRRNESDALPTRCTRDWHCLGLATHFRDGKPNKARRRRGHGQHRGAMERVTCTTCAALIEVRKSSGEQTRIKFHADALGACLERGASRPGSGLNATFLGCAALDLSIREPAVRRSSSAQSGDAFSVNPEGNPH